MSRITLTDVIRFLEGKGWQLKNFADSKRLFFQGPSSDKGNPLQISLPSSDIYVDYYERINDLLNTLSKVYSESVETLLNRIALVAHDLLRMKVVSGLTENNTIPLDIAVNEVKGLKGLFLWGACSEYTSKPHFDKALSLAEKHVKNCRFGHTFEGSFGFTISSPLLSDYSQLSLFTGEVEPPYERRVMERIVRGLSIMKEAVAEDNASIFVDNFSVGFNARMCDALIEMSNEQKNLLSFEVDWSYQINPSPGLSKIKWIEIGAKEIELAKYASDELKKIAPFQEVIIGKITTLHSVIEPLSDVEIPRSAIIKYKYEDRVVDVKLELNKNQYLQAYEAHGAGQIIRVKGDLYRRGSVWKMDNVLSVEIL
ncbi:hypothetical protein LEP1GSC024_0892 [Leptospira noguchii str. 2001034031]|uniref:Uncharacterized protein n=1 Tax=Leptospira noguchii str. 2001034031 TaxID=1193053 RepID=M6XYE1_9LEPT|nr:hypothetical protein LEP1GSC024_0892 [Leptospira noguchii str. 2001034031]